MASTQSLICDLKSRTFPSLNTRKMIHCIAFYKSEIEKLTNALFAFAILSFNGSILSFNFMCAYVLAKSVFVKDLVLFGIPRIKFFDRRFFLFIKPVQCICLTL